MGTDARDLMRYLRLNAESLPVAELARLVERAALSMSLADLASASSALADAPSSTTAMHAFGYACMEHDASFLAVPALTEALTRDPASRPIMMELASALEREERHAEAVAVLERRDADLEPWPDRYLLVYNAVLSGDLAKARAQFERLSGPSEERWLPAYDRVRRMLDRSADSTPGPRDLRGWHYVLTGGILSTLCSDEETTGRWAYVGDTYARCLLGLNRLRLILDTTGVRFRTVSLLPDRSSLILGLAASLLLGVPAEPFGGGSPGSVVIAYDLRDSDEIMPFLRERHPHQIVYEHATCWTDPPLVAADVSTLLVQTITPPWPLERPADAAALEITRAGEEPLVDEPLATFARDVTDHWLTGPRDGVPSSGPVPGDRFA